MGLAAALTAYRAALAASPASLTNLFEFGDIDDLPDTKKTYFRLTVASFGPMGVIHGGGAMEDYLAELKLEVVWFLDVDREGIYGTIATDVENVFNVMLASGNRNSTTVTMDVGSPFTFEERKNLIKGTATFAMRERLTQTL